MVAGTPITIGTRGEGKMNIDVKAHHVLLGFEITTGF